MYLQMVPMDEMAMPLAFSPWTAADFALNVAIWWVMMPGMMLPSAAPMILTFARSTGASAVAASPLCRLRCSPPVTSPPGGCSALPPPRRLGARADRTDVADDAEADPALGAALIIVAGIYQLTPFKYVCLTHCRSPFDFVLNHWHDGPAGALRMGFEHGLYCLGCCWFLMTLLFAAGT